MKTGDYFWHELMTNDTDKAKKFYKDVLGWDLKTVDMGSPGPYHVWVHQGTDHGGMMKIDPKFMPNMPPHWMIYVKVDDIDGVADRIPKLGGKILHGPMDVPEVGRFCTIQDPTGAAIALIQPSE